MLIGTDFSSRSTLIGSLSTVDRVGAGVLVFEAGGFGALGADVVAAAAGAPPDLEP